MAEPKVAVIMDYQNIHLTAHGLFVPYGRPVWESLIHPLLFAEQLLAARALAQGDERQKSAVLADVFVYRGAPSNAHQPTLYRITQAHKSEWTRDPRVHVAYRALKYTQDRAPQEKGVDVLVAINLVRLAQAGEHDVVILAAHDTDLEPALEMAAKSGNAKVETAGWRGSRRLRFPGQSVWHTALDGAAMVRSRDRKDYSHHT